MGGKRKRMIKAFWYLWRKTGLPDEVRRKYLGELIGKTSLKEMNEEELAIVLDDLRATVGEPYRKKRKARKHYKDREGREKRVKIASVKQIELIEKLRKEVGFDEEEFIAWVKRMWGSARILTSRQAVAVIEALKAMKLRGYRVGAR